MFRKLFESLKIGSPEAGGDGGKGSEEVKVESGGEERIGLVQKVIDRLPRVICSVGDVGWELNIGMLSFFLYQFSFLFLLQICLIPLAY